MDETPLQKPQNRLRQILFEFEPICSVVEFKDGRHIVIQCIIHVNTFDMHGNCMHDLEKLFIDWSYIIIHGS